MREWLGVLAIVALFFGALAFVVNAIDDHEWVPAPDGCYLKVDSVYSWNRWQNPDVTSVLYCPKGSS